MILDLPRVIAAERPYWTALEKTLDLLERDPNRKLTIQEAEAIPRVIRARSRCAGTRE